jgi:hypothetical protein
MVYNKFMTEGGSMEGITLGGVIALIGLCCSICSIAAFFIGRRKAATDEAKEEAKVSLDLKYIKDTVKEQTKSLETLTLKLDTQSAQREREYREILVKFTELETKHRLLRDDVSAMKNEIAMYHHHN